MSNYPTIDQLVAGIEVELEMAQKRSSKAKAEVKLILDGASGEGRSNLTSEEDQRTTELFAVIDRANTDADGIKGKLSRALKIRAEELESDRLASIVRPGAPAPSFGDTEHRVGADSRTLFGAGTSGDRPQFTRDDGRPATVARGERWADNSIVREESAKYAERDRVIEGTHGDLGQLVRSISTTSGAASLVPTAWSADVIDKARNASVVLNAGASLVPMNAKVVQIPRLTTDPAPVFKTEMSAVTATDPAFDFIQLSAVSLSTVVVCSVELLQDASNASDVVTNALGEAMALEIDKAALFGQLGATGTNDEGAAYALASPYPMGLLKNLLTNASAQVLGFATNGTAQTGATPWNELLAAYYQVKVQNENPVAMVSSDKLVQQYMSMYDSTNQPLRKPMVLDGLPWLTSNMIPSFTRGTMTSRATDVFVGDWSQLLIGQRMSLDIRVLTERYAELGAVGLLAYWRGDVQVARPKGLACYRALQGA